MAERVSCSGTNISPLNIQLSRVACLFNAASGLPLKWWCKEHEVFDCSCPLPQVSFHLPIFATVRLTDLQQQCTSCTPNPHAAYPSAVRHSATLSSGKFVVGKHLVTTFDHKISTT